ncbi:transcriptional regulator, HxlR family [Streptomyces sp. 3213]|uniref:winged helix-turn-helix transcriptional regulator n=1 Tax=Streptomyces sp. 3213.3 TaxID=1855348 RepID=UPI0008985F0E|nr:helix-turn-helix domain-containing protein [Streptomyces sp. 3213.3]SEC32916.1 transcriptional regulator, HxlR family [Streptomyces sp. 3213] [Streptomyces sp. 3213.3]
MLTPLRDSLTDRDSWYDVPCSGRLALELVSNQSTWILLREVYYGTTHFTDLARQAKVSQPTASARLAEMVDAGLLNKVSYQERGQRSRERYVLTDRGNQLMTVFFALMQWGDRHLAPDGGAVRLRHADCGAGVRAELHCNVGHTVTPDDLEVVPGPAIVNTEPLQEPGAV